MNGLTNVRNMERTHEPSDVQKVISFTRCNEVKFYGGIYGICVKQIAKDKSLVMSNGLVA